MSPRGSTTSAPVGNAKKNNNANDSANGNNGNNNANALVCVWCEVLFFLFTNKQLQTKNSLLLVCPPARLKCSETRYDAEEPNELTIHVGDRVHILKKNEQTGARKYNFVQVRLCFKYYDVCFRVATIYTAGWWLGQSKRGKGWLPGDFVVPL